MKKQTAVEWLESHLIECGFDWSFFNEFKIQQAKDMEQNQQQALAIGFGEWLNTEEPLALILDLNGYQDFSELLEIYKKRNFVNENEIKNQLFEPEPKFKLNSFCETPDEKCSMNYCDENGCQNRKTELVEPQEEPKQETNHSYIEDQKERRRKLFNVIEELERENSRLFIELNQQMYSEKDMKQYAWECVAFFLSDTENKVEQKLLEVIIDRNNNQFKKFRKK
jgi:hypothetical protein